MTGELKTQREEKEKKKLLVQATASKEYASMHTELKLIPTDIHFNGRLGE